MAQPFDSATTQQSVAKVLEEQYFKDFLEQTFFEGNVTNRLVELADEPVVGDGLNIKVERYAGDNIRPDTDALSDFPLPSAFVPETSKVRWNERDATKHDFTKFHGTGRVSVYEMENAADEGAIVDIADKIYGDIKPDYMFKLALLRNCDRTGKVATMPSSGTNKKNNDFDNFSDATTYTTGATSARLSLSGGSGPIAAFQPGKTFDIYNSSGTVTFTGARVTDYNPTDNSIGLERRDTNSTANFDAVGNSDQFYLNTGKGKGMYGFGAWFGRPAAGDSFIGGVDRTAAAFRYYNIRSTRIGQTARKVAKSDLDDLGDAMASATDREDLFYAAWAHQSIITSMRQAIGDAAFIAWPSDKGSAKRFANFGTMGLNYQHPLFGNISFLAEPLMIANAMRFARAGDWKSLYHGTKGLRFMKDYGSIWYRMQSAVPGGGKGMFYNCDAYANHCDYCMYPNLQGQILNITA